MFDNNLNAVDPSDDFQTADNPGSKSSPIVLRFWQIECFFKCPVVGLCLTFYEQKQLLKKEGISLKGLSAFEIHERLVASAENKNTLSKKVDDLLSSKFGRHAAALRNLSEEAFMYHVRASFEAAQYGPALWAAASRANLSAKAKREIFGTIHMSMHANAERNIQVVQQLNQFRKKVEDQSLAILALKHARKDFQKENDALRREHAQIKAKLLSVAKEKDELRGGLEALKGQDRIIEPETENRRLRAELSNQTERFISMKRGLRHRENRFAVAAEDIEKRKRADKRFKDEVEESIQSPRNANGCDPTCPAFDLCPKRVLIVGGIERMEALYRQIIEAAGGIMEYHDGNMHGGTMQLENSLRRADIVLCPVNCNSHNACLLTKKLGKKYEKPVYMLASSSLSGISRALFDYQNRQSVR